MSKVKNKKTLIAIVAVVAVALVGGVIAANRTIFTFNNSLTIGGNMEVELEETFDSPDDWKPCDSTPKLVTVRNTGDMDAQVRIKMKESWKSTSGQPLALVKDGVNLVNFTFANDDWELTDGYYYLDHTLAAGDSEDFLTAVTFNCDADFGEMDLCYSDGNCTVDNNGYNGATYHLVVTAQFMQDEEDADWNVEFGYKAPNTFSNLNSGFSSYFGSIKAGRQMVAFKRSKVLPDAATVSNMQDVRYDKSSSSTDVPIYMWYDPSDLTVYWYSTADAVRWNQYDYADGMFSGMMFSQMPEDISGLEYFDFSRVTSSSYVDEIFCGPFIPDDLSAISHWTFGINYWDQDFFTCHSGDTYYFKQEHMSGIEHWKFPNMYEYGFNSYYLFYNNPNITSLEKLSGWDMSKYTGLSYVFAYMPNLVDLHGIENWLPENTKVTNLYSMFYYSPKVKDLSPIAGWNVSKVTDFSNMFYNGNSTTDGIVSVAPLVGWSTKLTSANYMSYMFYGQAQLTDATPLNSWAWRMNQISSKSGMFMNTGCTSGTYPTWYTP